jgi:regulator of protease activity HflC (stomatin/prohibitin superfamily)
MIVLLITVAVLVLLGLPLSLRIVTQYEKGVLFRLGRVKTVKDPGLAMIVPVVDVLRKVSLRIITMPIQSQGSSPKTTSALTSRLSLTTGLSMQ